jgi:pilus assembly protein CpaB
VKRMKAARYVVLGVAVAAGGLAALLAGGGDDKPVEAPKPVVQFETVDVLIAKSDIGIGQVVSAQDLQWQSWPAATAGTNFIRKSERANAIEDIAGSVARGAFLNGEPIREGKLVKVGTAGYMAAVLPKGKRAVSTEISAETAAGGFILPGDHVDVILTIRKDRDDKKKDDSEPATSETVLSNVRVLAIDQTVEEKNGQKVVVGKTTTLEMTPRQTETLALSRTLGSLSLALRSIVDIAPDSDTPDTDKNSKRGTVNMVRFGVPTLTTPK